MKWLILTMLCTLSSAATTGVVVSSFAVRNRCQTVGSGFWVGGFRVLLSSTNYSTYDGSSMCVKFDQYYIMAATYMSGTGQPPLLLWHPGMEAEDIIVKFSVDINSILTISGFWHHNSIQCGPVPTDTVKLGESLVLAGDDFSRDDDFGCPSGLGHHLRANLTFHGLC
jgi:hypothetical protein